MARRKRQTLLGGTDLGAVGFFARNAFFRHDDFAAHYTAAGHRATAVSPILEYYARTGHIRRLRRGLYVTTASDMDPWLLGTLLGRETVIAYDGALSFHGVTGLGHSLTVAAAAAAPEFAFNEVIYRVVKNPAFGGVVEHDHRGHRINVTTLSRTLVDLLDRPDLGPGLVATFMAFATQPDLPIDFDAVVEHVKRRHSGVCAARVGVFLWGHPTWRYRMAHQQMLMDLLPKQTTHVEPGRPTGKGEYVARFRTIVPHRLLDAIERCRRRA